MVWSSLRAVWYLQRPCNASVCRGIVKRTLACIERPFYLLQSTQAANLTGGLVADGKEVCFLALCPALESGPEEFLQEDLDTGRDRDRDEQAVDTCERAAGE